MCQLNMIILFQFINILNVPCQWWTSFPGRRCRNGPSESPPLQCPPKPPSCVTTSPESLSTCIIIIIIIIIIYLVQL